MERVKSAFRLGKNNSQTVSTDHNGQVSTELSCKSGLRLIFLEIKLNEVCDIALSPLEPLSELGILLCGDHHTASTNVYFTWYSAYLREVFSFISPSIVGRLGTASALSGIDQFHRSLGTAASMIQHKEDLSYGGLWEDLSIPQVNESGVAQTLEEVTQDPEDDSQSRVQKVTQPKLAIKVQIWIQRRVCNMSS